MPHPDHEITQYIVFVHKQCVYIKLYQRTWNSTRCYNTVEPPKRGRYGDEHFVLSREVVLFRRFLFSRMRSEDYCGWVCLFVESNLTLYGAPVRPENAVTYSQRATKINIIHNCADLPETTAFNNAAKHEQNKHANYSGLPAVSLAA